MAEAGAGNGAAPFSWIPAQVLSDRGRTDKEPAVCTNDQKCILRIRMLGIGRGDAVFLPLADFTGMHAAGFPGNFEYCHLRNAPSRAVGAAALFDGQ